MQAHTTLTHHLQIIFPVRLEAAKASVIRAYSPELWLGPLLALAPPGNNGTTHLKSLWEKN